MLFCACLHFNVCFTCSWFLIGWVGRYIRIGLLTASILFAVFFLLGGIFLAIVGDLSWVSVSLPLVGATIYSILPNFLPSQIDDTVVMAAGGNAYICIMA